MFVQAQVHHITRHIWLHPPLFVSSNTGVETAMRCDVVCVAVHSHGVAVNGAWYTHPDLATLCHAPRGPPTCFDEFLPLTLAHIFLYHHELILLLVHSTRLTRQTVSISRSINFTTNLVLNITRMIPVSRR